MTDIDSTPDSRVVPPASPEMAAKLAVNRTGRLTPVQRRVALMAGVGALCMLLCPLTLVVQMVALVLSSGLPVVTVCSVSFLVVGLLFTLAFVGLIGTNVQMFLPEVFGQHPVRYARGPLEIHLSEKERIELPFCYIVGDYSFAPYVAPSDVMLRPGAPYLVYYSSRSRLLLSMAALDAPDAAQWEPEFGDESTWRP